MTLWFRRDLRIEDNRVLASAKDRAFPIFIFDKNILSKLKNDDRRVSFIFRNVLKLKEELKSIGLDLAIFFAKPRDLFEYLKSKGLDKVVASGDSNYYSIERDSLISEIIDLKVVNDSFLFEQDDILKDDNSIYRVFTPFYKRALSIFSEEFYFEAKAQNLKLIDIEFDFNKILEIDSSETFKRDISLSTLGFSEVKLPDFALHSPYEILDEFKSRVSNYKESRNFPSLNSTSKLSTHLRFGTISIREVVRILKSWQEDGLVVNEFFRQLIWREFFHYILTHYPHTKKSNFIDIEIPWDSDREKFQKWCEGQTGVPIVDAGMRELKRDGYMHNRVRMVVASFLTKDLHIDWRWGERHFSRELLDYEASSNSLSWQWASSTGVDPAPYFRIFNPYLQSKKFDFDASYIKSQVSELSDIESKKLHDENFLMQNSISNYPTPIVNHKLESAKSKEIFQKALKR